MGLTLDLYMPSDGGLGGLNKFHITFGNCEDPISESPPLKVLIDDPSSLLSGLSSLELGPQQGPEGCIDFAEGCLGHDVPMIIGPSPDDRVQCFDQPCLGL